MAITVSENSAPPIGRYIALAFVFLLLFVGVSYLIYRIRGGKTAAVPQASPTPIVQTTTPPTTNTDPYAYRPTLPAPQIQPINPNLRTFVAPTTAAVPIVKQNLYGYRSIAQDGNGNLLFDNLTHQENYQLLSQKGNFDGQAELARLNNQIALDRLRLTNQAQAEQQKQQNAHQLALAKQQADLELARIKNQLELAKLQATRQPTAENQTELTRLQQQYQLVQQQAQADQQVRLAQIQAETQLALQQNQADAQLKTILAQSQAQTSQIATQSYYGMAAQEQQLSYAQAGHLADLAYQAASRANEQQFMLMAQQLQADIIQAQRLDQHQQTMQLIGLQAEIQQDMLILSRQYGIGYNA